MKISSRIVSTISFKHVIPVKNVVINGLYDDNCSQMTLFNSEVKTANYSENDMRRSVQALNRILNRKDKAQPHSKEEYINDMIRCTFAYHDSDYKYYATPGEELVKTCYCGTQAYLLTGKEAQKYADICKNIGKSRRDDYEYQDAGFTNYNRNTRSAQRDFAISKNNIINDTTRRLKSRTLYPSLLGIELYIHRHQQPRKGSKGSYPVYDVNGISIK